MHETSNYVETIEKRQGLKISCIEEIAYRLDYIDIDQAQLLALGKVMEKNDYGQYLLRLALDEI